MSNPHSPEQELVVGAGQKLALRQVATAAALAFRARIVLECAAGANNAAVTAKLRPPGFCGDVAESLHQRGIVALGMKYERHARLQTPWHHEPLRGLITTATVA